MHKRGEIVHTRDGHTVDIVEVDTRSLSRTYLVRVVQDSQGYDEQLTWVARFGL